MKKPESPIARCPRLGCDIPFSYCLRERDPLPCSRIVSCWESRMPVERLLRERLTAEEWDRAFSDPPRDRLATLLEAAAKAKKS